MKNSAKNSAQDPAWEEWQLTAYLLNELEPEVGARIAAAAQRDTKLAQDLEGLSKTLSAVTQLLSSEARQAADPRILQTLQTNVSARLGSPAPAIDAEIEAEATLPTGFQRQPLWRRWENWASLAGLIVIGILLSQRQASWYSLGPALGLRETQSTAPESLANSTGGAVSGDSVDTYAASAPADDLNLMRDQSAVVSDSSIGRPLPGVDALEAQPGPNTSQLEGMQAQNLPAEKKLSAAQPESESVSGELPRVVANDVAPFRPGQRSFPYQYNLGVVPPGSPPAASLQPTPPSASLSASLATSGAEGGEAGGMGMMGGMMGGATSGAMPGGMGGYGAEGFGQSGGYGGSMGGYGDMGDAMPAMGGMGMGMGANPNSHFESEEARFGRRGGEELFRQRASGDRFTGFSDNEFLTVSDQPLSTFSVDVDTASYTKARQYLMEHHQVPPPASVRIEEFMNYFDYKYQGPKDQTPFAAALAVTSCPWQPQHQLVRIALQAKQVEASQRPKANLVFLLDVSGSMSEPNKLPLVKESIRLLTYQLTENDRVALVVYAGAAGCVLESTLGNRQDEILSAIERLNAGGSTNGGQGIQLAYQLARDHFIAGGINRVILCTDGDFNVGVTGTDALVSLVEEQAKTNIFLTVLGYGMGNTNDAMMEQIADRGNGIYGFVDSRQEAQRQMVKQLSGNLMTVAKDVKLQVEFNPAKVKAYRLIGYENRQLKTEDFNNDRKDAGEIGAGHRVTALYELVPLHLETTGTAQVEELRYQPKKRIAEPVAAAKSDSAASDAGNVNTDATSNELLAVKLRYKEPEGSESRLLTFPLDDKTVAYEQADSDFRWAAAMAEFGMLLRNSPHKGQANWSVLSDRARAAVGQPIDMQRTEALELIRIAREQLGRY